MISVRFDPDPSSSWAPYQIYNIGNSKPISLMEYIHVLENEIGIVAKKNFMEMQVGDVLATSSDTSKLENDINFKPSTDIKDGIKKFIDWYKIFYKIT